MPDKGLRGIVMDECNPTYDELGNMTDDDQHNTYEYDVWGRLRFVYNQSSDLVAEYRYNGLNQRISMHQDTDADGDVDVNDITYYFVHDDRWRVIATYHEDDDTGGTDGPKEQFIHHAAGVAGNGSYIDDVICRLKDANTAWTTASDGTLEERIYYCQNWRHDVVALIDSAGEVVEQARYEAYGTPIGMSLGDVDMNGRVTSADTTQISTWDSGGTYDVRGDLNLDGDVNTTDYNTSNGNTGTTLARGVLSDDPDTVGNRFGYAGYIFDDKPGFETFHVRNRWYNASIARWLTRDPLEYVDGPNMYGYVAANVLPSQIQNGGHANDTCDSRQRFCDMDATWGPLIKEAKERIRNSCGGYVNMSSLVRCLPADDDRCGDTGGCAAHAETNCSDLPPGQAGPPVRQISIEICENCSRHKFCEALVEELIHVAQYCEAGFFTMSCSDFEEDFDLDMCLGLEIEAKDFSTVCDDPNNPLRQICNERNFCLCALACASCDSHWLRRDWDLRDCLRHCKENHRRFNCPGLKQSVRDSVGIQPRCISR